MRITGRQWSVALTGAVLVHASVALAVLWQSPKSGAKSAGVGGIEIALGPAGGASGSVSPVEGMAEEAQGVAPDEVKAEALPAETVQKTTPDPITPVTPEAAVAEATPVEEAPVETLEPEPVIPTEVVEAIAPEPETETVAQETPVAVQAESVAAVAETAPAQETVAQAVVAAPKPRPKPPIQQRLEKQPEPAPVVAPRQTAPPEPTQTATAESPERATDQIAAVAPAAPSGAGGRAGTQASPDAGNADSPSSGGMPGETVDFMAQLQAWLERHKEYPRRARLRRQEGTALLYFVMDREGRVLDYRLERSSGHRLLDREVMDMLERAQPLPKMPDQMSQARLELVVPVQFFLR